MWWFLESVSDGELGRRSAADRAPDAELGRATGRELRRGELDDDGEQVGALERIDRGGRGAERAGGWRVRDQRERSGGRLPVGQDAEELLEIEEERVFARAGEHLHARGGAERLVDRAGDDRSAGAHGVH